MEKKKGKMGTVSTLMYSSVLTAGLTLFIKKYLGGIRAGAQHLGYPDICSNLCVAEKVQIYKRTAVPEKEKISDSFWRVLCYDGSTGSVSGMGRFYIGGKFGGSSA